MESVSKEMFAIVQYLLPGFISAWIFYGLTSFKKPSQFERIIQALIFTIFVQAIMYLMQKLLTFSGKSVFFGTWSTATYLVLSILTAIAPGLLFSYFANNDKLHKLFRKFGITKETSYPSEWFGAFLNITYIVIHLNDGRRISGWPRK